MIERYSVFRALFGQGQPSDRSGYERWPAERVVFPPAMPLRLRTLPNDVQRLSVNGEAPDAVAGVDEYDWYLSQRTDEPERALFRRAPVEGQSGSVDLRAGPAALALGLSNPVLGAGLPLDVRARLLADLWLYVRRRGDGTILCASFDAVSGP